MSFAVERRVRFAHCDPAGIVYYPRLFEMIDGAIEDWFRATLGAGRGETHLVRRLGTPVVGIETRFVVASRLDDLLILTVSPTAFGRSSLELAVEMSCGPERRLTARVRQVLIDLDAMKRVDWPDDWRRAIEREIET